MEKKKLWCVPKLTPEYRERMDDVLECYERPYDKDEPVVCVDEKSLQLLETPRPSGHPDRIDYEYKRNGTCNLFVAVEPKRGRRRVEVTRRRTKGDFALFMQDLVMGTYRSAKRVHVVLDNLNTHNDKALLEGLGEREARRLIKRIEWHHTPKHASWLNAVEGEIGILDRQCLKRRIGTEDVLKTQVAAWQDRRNAERVPIVWTFTRASARQTFPQLYKT